MKNSHVKSRNCEQLLYERNATELEFIPLKTKKVLGSRLKFSGRLNITKTILDFRTEKCGNKIKLLFRLKPNQSQNRKKTFMPFHGGRCLKIG